jgi:tRNA-(ms[2]io[6]A)-hydroxylase
MLGLRTPTPPRWTELALSQLTAFLQDHAANERKVSQSALLVAVQHPTKDQMCSALIAVALEELDHFRQVHQLLLARGDNLGFEQPDPYMTELRTVMRKKRVDDYLLDRLLLFGIVEARGCERFAMMADGLQETMPDSELAVFYRDLVRCEARHHELYHRLAREHFDKALVDPRLDELLDIEAAVLKKQPLRPALH